MAAKGWKADIRTYWLYHLLNDRAEVIYVGITSQPKQRALAWRRGLGHRLSDETLANLRWQRLGEMSYLDAQIIEAKEVLRLGPKGNAIRGMEPLLQAARSA